MFRFEDPQYLWLLTVVAALAIIRLITYRNQKKRLRKFGDPVLLRELMPDVSRWRPGVKFCLLEAALALLIVMLARPQFGSRISEEKRAGIETIICLDISNSMRARDVNPSRLDRAKMMVENMVDRFTDDKIGLIVFAGDAFVQLPITSDYVSAKMFLSSIDPSMMVNQGTDVAAAVTMASHSFTQQEDIGKAIIVITDGEDHEGGALEAAKDARGRGMNVFVLGVGSTKGAPIPEGTSGNYMTDRTGETVMSRLNEQMCRDIAQAGGGAYIHVDNNSNAQRQLDNELDKLQKSETSIYSDFDEQFQAVGIIALLLLILEICILDRKNPALKKVKLFKRNTPALSVFMLLFALGISPLHAQDNSQSRKFIRKGNKEYRADKRQEAQVTYLKALEADTTYAPAMYNLATSMFPQDWKSVEQERRGQMIQALMKAAQTEQNPIRKSKALHNVGVLYQGAQDYKMAIEAYKEALRNNPHDDEARYNLVLCQKQQKDGEGQNQNQQGDNKDQQGEQQKQDQQEQQQNQQDQQEQEPPMSKENAEQLLQAAMQQEKQTQKRLKEQQMQSQRRQVEKNW